MMKPLYHIRSTGAFSSGMLKITAFLTKEISNDGAITSWLLASSQTPRLLSSQTSNLDLFKNKSQFDFLETSLGSKQISTIYYVHT